MSKIDENIYCIEKEKNNICENCGRHGRLIAYGETGAKVCYICRTIDNTELIKFGFTKIIKKVDDNIKIEKNKKMELRILGGETNYINFLKSDDYTIFQKVQDVIECLSVLKTEKLFDTYDKRVKAACSNSYMSIRKVLDNGDSSCIGSINYKYSFYNEVLFDIYLHPDIINIKNSEIINEYYNNILQKTEELSRMIGLTEMKTLISFSDKELQTLYKIKNFDCITSDVNEKGEVILLYSKKLNIFEFKVGIYISEDDAVPYEVSIEGANIYQLKISIK